MIKRILFNLHLCCVYIFTYGWVLHPYIVYIQYIVLLSWLLNNNKCLVTQLEYYFFNETFLGEKKKFIVPHSNRHILILNCILATINKLSKDISILKYVL